MKTILSVTPVKVEADSRTFKIAASFARFGYRSIVIEGGKSFLDKNQLPFELISRNADIATSAQYKNDVTVNNQSVAPFKTKIIKFLENPFPVLPKYYRKYYQKLYKIYYRFKYRSIYERQFPFKKILNDIPPASLYYLHGYSVFLAEYIKKKYKAPVIYDAHDYYLDTLSRQDEYYKTYYSTFFKLEKKGIKNSMAVVTVSTGVADMIHRTFGCNPVVIRNSHDHRLDIDPPVDIRRYLSLADREFLFVVVSGSAKPGQAVAEAIEAMTFLPSNVHLAFLGKGYEKYLEEISQRNLNGRVHMVPPVKSNEVVNFIKAANASLILYYPLSVDYLNALPNRFFQSIAAELPVLYPEGLTEINKIAKIYDIGIPIDPKDGQTIKRGIKRLIEEPELFNIYKQNIKKAKEELSWENEERILLGLIEKVDT